MSCIGTTAVVNNPTAAPGTFTIVAVVAIHRIVNTRLRLFALLLDFVGQLEALPLKCFVQSFKPFGPRSVSCILLCTVDLEGTGSIVCKQLTLRVHTPYSSTTQHPTNITMPPRHAFHKRTWSISFNKVRCRVMLVFIASSALRRVSMSETGGYMRDPPGRAVAAAPRRPSRSSRSCRRLRRRSEAAPACLPPPPFASFAFAASFADRRWDALKSSHASPFGCGVPHVAHVSTCG